MTHVFYEQDDVFPLNNAVPLLLHYCEITTPVLSHWHTHLEILLPVTGEIELIIDAEKIRAQPGELVIINANKLHTIQPVNQHAVYRCLIIDAHYFNEQGLNYSHYSFPNKTRQTELVETYKTLATTFDLDESSLAHGFYVKSLLLQFMADLFHYLQPVELPTPMQLHATQSKSDIVKQGIEYLNHHFHELIQIDDICLSIGVSKFYFCRLFKEVTDQTVTQYLNQLRCTRAQHLLTTSTLSIADCAESCGFNDSSYFTKIYKQHVGHLPSQERKLSTQQP